MFARSLLETLPLVLFFKIQMIEPKQPEESESTQNQNVSSHFLITLINSPLGAKIWSAKTMDVDWAGDELKMIKKVGGRK